MKLLAALLSFALLAGCESTKQEPTYSAPSAAGVRMTVSKAAGSVTSAQSGTEKAKGSVVAIQGDVQAIIAKAPQVQAELESVHFRLSAVLRELDAVSTSHAHAILELQDADSRAEALQSEVNRQTDTLNTTVTAKNKALTRVEEVTGERNQYRASLWKWRVATGTILLGLVLFLFRKPLGMLFGIPVP